MKMFESYNNTPSSYIPNNSCPTMISIKECNQLPLEVYNIKGELIGYTWSRGDSIVLNFITTGVVTYDEGAYEDAETYMRGKTLQFNFYDHMYNMIFQETVDASDDVKFYIESDKYNLLEGNIYYCTLTLLDNENNIVNTLVNITDCKFYIK